MTIERGGADDCWVSGAPVALKYPLGGGRQLVDHLGGRRKREREGWRDEGGRGKGGRRKGEREGWSDEGGGGRVGVMMEEGREGGLE